MEITQEQIDQLKEVGNEKTKELLNEWFGIKIEPHVWYYWEECSSSYVFAYSNVERNEVYGFINSDCFGYSLLKPRIDFRLATKEEVEPLLISEAKKRGYKNGNYECLTTYTEFVDDENNYDYIHEYNPLFQGTNMIFKNGKWAEIIPTMTIEEAEKKLNCRIIK